MSDRFPYFCEEVCGNLWENKLLSHRIPVNAGLIGMKPEIDISDHFYEASKQVKYGETPDSYFLDEQGAFNIGLYASDIPFSLLPRDVNVYGSELFDRLNRGIRVELCHFIGRTKNLFHKIEPLIFRKIHDGNYTMEDFYQSALNDVQRIGFQGRLIDMESNI